MGTTATDSTESGSKHYFGLDYLEIVRYLETREPQRCGQGEERVIWPVQIGMV